MNISTPAQRRISPWIGVRPFGNDDAGRFFGRSSEITELAGLWLRRRLTLLQGDSGIGKTSLLNAGLFPHLRATGENVLPIGDPTLRPAMPAPALASVNRYSFSILASWQPDEPATRVLSVPIAEFLRRRERFVPGRPAAPTLVAVDQLHQSPSGGSAGQDRSRFLRELVEAVAALPNVHLLLSTRTADDEAARSVTEVLGDDDTARFVLGPLGRDSAIEAVTRPLTLAGMSFEAGVAGRLIDEVSGTPGTSPASVEPVLLQIAATALWERLGDDDAIVPTRLVPDVELSLAHYCARALDTITTDHGLPTCEVGTWLRRAFLTPGGGDRLVSPAARPAEMTDSLIQAVEDRYLLTTVRRDGVPFHRLRYPQLAGVLQRLNEVRLPARHREPAEWLHSAELALAAGDMTLAERHARAATQTSRPDQKQVQARAESLLGDIAFQQGRNDLAEDHYRAATTGFELLQNPAEAARLLAAVGRLRLARGDHAGALDALSIAILRAPDDPSVQIGLGQVFWYGELPKAALGMLDRVLRTGGNADARRFRGEILADLGRAEGALRDLDQAGSRALPSARAARALALCLLSGGTAAPEDLEEIVTSAPGSGPVLLRTARVMALRGDAGGAAALAARALRADDPPLTPLQREQAERLAPDR